MTATDDVFEGERNRLFGLAYRLLGSAADAEDTVQEAFLRWHAADRSAIETHGTWLTKVVTNLCLNHLTSARVRRERTGPWLPEPLLTEHGALGPLESAEQRESVSLALLMLLERLTPAERAVFVLREAFGYAYENIAAIVTTSEANCRQLHSRARRRIGDGRTRFDAPDEQARRLAERFLTAARSGDLAALEDLLAADVTAWMDAGPSARRMLHGREEVRRLAVVALARFASSTMVTEVNAAPALLFVRAEALLGVTVFEIDGGRIHGVRTVIDPRKLAVISRRLPLTGEVEPGTQGASRARTRRPEDSAAGVDG
ncbi:RNA polymerase sigma factor SigJ [Actinoallomurus purpureus]|uniref:RNA polymerase sigma factor SigJ n=1 Tax=Actinoallomurus purpureus TaxID=478114 RepID=UPI002092EDD2|nr:RNA polymerase sigma factor SigJ [Actinoallomurus purpureus]MCO6005550.1 RNA polymerase sigma factor SigJ [Actinoallomurus purpureus]